MLYIPFCSTQITFNKLDQFKNTLKTIVDYNVLFLMSNSAAQRMNLIDYIDDLKQQNKQKGNVFFWLNNIPSNPTYEDVFYALSSINEESINLIVAVGGGSAIDLAKSISAFYTDKLNGNLSKETIKESIKNKLYLNNEFLDIIACPTTSGTGSEISQWATIWDKQMNMKYSIDSPNLKPKLAIIVPEFTLSMPNHMTLSSGLDAMSQAIEAYWSKHTTPIVQEIAYRAISLIIDNLKASLNSPDDLVFRENLSRASVLSALAFSQTRTTACHSISYPLTMFHGIPHGIATSMTLEQVGRYNKGLFEKDKELFSLFGTYGSIKRFIDFVSEGIYEVNLSYFGINVDDIPNIVENAFTSGRMDNNPYDLSKEEVKSILKSVF